MTGLLNTPWRTTNLALDIQHLDRNALVKAYAEARRNAPHRHDRGLRFFVSGHDGGLSGSKPSGRYEEHLAMAIRHCHDVRWPRAGGGWLRYLDYQFPLKAARADAGVGKVDLFGVTDDGRLVVSELKVPPSGRGRGAGPMEALMQALRYAAIVEANGQAIGEEAMGVFGLASVSEEPPIVQILGPKAWWRRWFLLEGSTRRKAGQWEVAFIELVHDIRDRLGIVVECVAMDVSKAAIYGVQEQPTLQSQPTTYEVRFGGVLDIDSLRGKFIPFPATHKHLVPRAQ